MSILPDRKRVSIILSELYQWVRHGRLSEIEAYLQKRPEACYIFTVIGKLKNESFSLFMLAALNGHDNLVRLMLMQGLSVKRNIDQKGCVWDTNGNLVNNVTALWCSLDRGHFHVAHTLIHLGSANVNIGQKGSLLIDAIIQERFDIVYFLVNNGYADVNCVMTRNKYNFSSLALSVIKGNILIAKYLIARGANIEYEASLHDIRPLVVAIKYNRLEIAHLLLSLGASSNVKISSGETPIMLAAKYGHRKMVELLLKFNHDETTLDDLELGAAFIMLDNNHDALPVRSRKMIDLLRLSMEARIQLNKPKPIRQPIPAYDKQQECRSRNELDQIEHDHDRLYVEALLVQERILLPQNNHKLFQPLLERAILLAERAEYDRCLNLMLHTFYLYQKMEMRTGLHRFVWVFCKMLNENIPINIARFLDVCRLVFEPSQRNSIEDNIMNTVYLLALAAKILEQYTLSNQDRHSIILWIKDLCQQQRLTEKGETLLHFSVDIETYWSINYRRADTIRIIKFPNLAVTRLLLSYGRRWIDLDAVDREQGDTALHKISQSWMIFFEDDRDKRVIIELLINAGSHIDCVNNFGQRPIDVASDDVTRLQLRSAQGLPRLKCLCAHLISDQNLAFQHICSASTSISKFLQLHSIFKRKRSISESGIDS